jgi:hypothetical protein
MGAERLRIAERRFGREMILERHFSLHGSPSAEGHVARMGFPNNAVVPA